MWKSMLIFGLLSLFFGSIRGLFVISERETHMFVEYKLQVNWYEALRICLSHNMTLISPSTVEKNMELTKFVSDLVELNGKHFWTSGQEVDNYNYVWTSTGNNISWTNWRRNEPCRKNWKKTQCIGFYIDAWESYTCTQPKHFICEINLYLRDKIYEERKKCYTRNQKNIQQEENEQMKTQLILAKQSFELKSKEFPMLREFYQQEIELLEEKINSIAYGTNSHE